jgi:hypothetical protein
MDPEAAREDLTVTRALGVSIIPDRGEWDGGSIWPRAWAWMISR